MTRIYLDANIVVYLVENTPKAAAVRKQMLQLNNPHPYSSDLALCECLVMPLRANHHALVLAYDQFFKEIARIRNSQRVFRLAADLRARSALRTPDALHLAYALSAPGEIFLPADQRLAQSWESLQSFDSNLQVVVV
ncbi:MAG: type II toxin-antitoxin system VapC family toxin [Fimbriimonadia bacterium]|nr:type II toxin-antitoxin system VapC family toxin [Fimbriimonadia bacterium]